METHWAMRTTNPGALGPGDQDNAGQHPLLQRRLVVYSELSSRGRVAVTLRQGALWILFLGASTSAYELPWKESPITWRTSPMGAGRGGSAGPCHALDPTGKGLLTVFPWVRYFRSVANLSEPKPETLLGPIDS